MKHVLSLVAVAALATVASAEPLGTPLAVTVSHSGQFGETQNFVHNYGSSQQVFDSFGFSYLVMSPAQVPGWQNALRLDFANFAYTDFAGETGTISITGFATPVLSATFLNSNAGVIPGATSTPASISGSWAVDAVNATGTPVLFVAWNKVPTPGALALFGVAGLTGLRRRR